MCWYSWLCLLFVRMQIIINFRCIIYVLTLTLTSLKLQSISPVKKRRERTEIPARVKTISFPSNITTTLLPDKYLPYVWMKI